MFDNPDGKQDIIDFVSSLAKYAMVLDSLRVGVGVSRDSWRTSPVTNWVHVGPRYPHVWCTSCTRSIATRQQNAALKVELDRLLAMATPTSSPGPSYRSGAAVEWLPVAPLRHVKLQKHGPPSAGIPC